MLSAVVNIGSLFLDISKKIYPDNKDIETASNAADLAKQAYNVVNTASVHQSANRAIIAPMTVIDDSILHSEYMNDLMQIVMLRDIVAVLTHIAMQATTSVGVKVENVIGSINPKRSGFLSLQGLETLDTSITKITGNESKNKDEDSDKPEGIQANAKATSELTEYTPLAVGKVVNAVIHREKGSSIDFPLTFRQTPIPVNYPALEKIFGATKVETGFSARYFQLTKTGELTSPEFLTGSDIIKERFRIKNEDMSGYYKEALNRETNNKRAAFKSGILSLNTLANCFIISKDTANQLELSIGKRFDNERSRNEIFKSLKANSLVIVNEDRGIFTFYTIGNDLPETYTRNDIKVKAKKDTGSSTLNDLVNILNGGR